MKDYKKYLLPLSFMIAFLLTGALYPIFNTDSRGVYSLVTEFDKMVPFVKEFIIPYITWYPFLGLGLLYFFFKDKDIYYKVIISLIVGMLISYGTYLVFQTTVPRPELAGNDLFTKLISNIYKQDKPFNCFPSLHVLETYTIIKGVKASADRNKLIDFITVFVGSLIIISTQFIKQHVILDLIFAIILAEIVFNLVYKLDLNKCTAYIKTSVLSMFGKKKTEDY